MVLRHWDPFHEMRRMQGGFDRFQNGLPIWDVSSEPHTWDIQVDVIREGY